MIEKKEEQWLTPQQIADKYHVTRQAISVGCKNKRFEIRKKGRQYLICESSYNDYRGQKYSRLLSKYNGKPLYDSEFKEMSVAQAAKFLGWTAGRIYYAVRTGSIPYFRKGYAIIIKYEDLLKFRKEIPEQLVFL